MQVVHTLKELRETVSKNRLSGKRIGFVPTMGNLHEGHLSLIDAARRDSDFVVCSIFVNPMQFGKNEDLDAYPRTISEDTQALTDRNCDLLFVPSVREVYPNGLEQETRIDVPGVSAGFCGASRPGHFVGVATVVCKLFNMVQPDVAVFGKKDFQQLAVIRKMVQDLCIPVDIQGLDTSRESNGLARSSRNGYLTDDERSFAATIYRLLTETAREIEQGNRHYKKLEQALLDSLDEAGFKIDYVGIADSKTLLPASQDSVRVVILVAVWLGTTRLIDNIEVEGLKQ